MVVRLASGLCLQRRFAVDRLNLLTVYNAVMALVYSVAVQPGDSVECLRAVEDLELATELFAVLGRKFPASRIVGDMVGRVIERFRVMGRRAD